MLSLSVFALYINDLSKLVLKSLSGCQLDNVRLIHLYTDDVNLLARYSMALHGFINICRLFGLDRSIMRIATKVQYFTVPTLWLNGISLKYA